MTRKHQQIVGRLAELLARGCYFEIQSCGCVSIGPGALLTATDRAFLDAHKQDVSKVLVAVADAADADLLSAPVGDAVH